MVRHIHVEINPMDYFKDEVAKITNPLLVALLTESLEKVPSYFWFVPASSSGKYHPKSSLGMHGLVRHVRSVFAISEELLTHKMYAPFNEYEKDLIRVAIILHDTFKQGTEEWGTKTVTEHPLLVREHARPDVYIQNTDAGEQQWDIICSLIETHMGIWTTDKQGNQVLQEPETAMQKFVHLCDYIASRKIISIDFEERGEQVSNVEKPFEPATEKQISYLQSLYVQAKNRGLVLDPIAITDANGKTILSKADAGQKITDAKTRLGF